MEESHRSVLPSQVKTVKPIQVQSMRNPFVGQRKLQEFAPKTRLSDILSEALGHSELINHSRVWISDANEEHEPLYVKPKDYGSIIVKGNTRVSIKIVPSGGGGGGGKDVLRIVATVALIVVTAGYGAALGTALTGAAKATAATTALGSGLIMMVGSLAINALIPPTTPNLSQRGNTAPKESPTLGITGAQNSANPFGTVPRVFGRHKVYPTYAAQPYTEISGNDQYLRLLFDFGYGELELDELKIGNTLLSNYDDVETQIRYGASGDAAITLYSMNITEDTFSILITNAGGAQTVTTEPNSNEAIVDGVFQGLVSISDDGTYQNLTVDIKYEYSLAGAGSWTTVATESYTSNTTQAYYTTKRISLPTTDQYDIRITRVTQDYASNLIKSDFYLSNLKSVKDESPINSSLLGKRCLVAMRIKATDQLNGVIDQFNAVATSKLPTYNGSSWVAASSTRNPAWAFAEVLRGAANETPIDDAQIDADSIKAWADACDVVQSDGNPKWTFDAVIDFNTTVYETLRDIAAAGRASLTTIDGKFGVVRDVEQTTPIQHFTPRNSWGFESSKIFIEKVHALKCRFINPDNDWQQDEVIVYDDGYTVSNATQFASVQFWGCTNRDQAWRDGRYHIAVSRLRPEIYTLNVDIENLICTRGDLVRVTHDVTGWGQKGARIASLTTDGGGNVTHITLDEEVTMEAATNYNLRIRRQDGSSTLHSIVLNVATVTQLELTTAIPLASVPDVGDLCMFGEEDLESVELIVKAIEFNDEFNATLTLLDAAPNVHSADTSPIPAFDPKITGTPPRVKSSPANVQVLSIESDEDVLYYNSQGELSPQIVVDIVPPPLGFNVPRDAIRVRYRQADVNAKYQYITYSGDSTRLEIRPVEEGIKYDVGVRAESRFGQVSEWTTELSYLVEGRINPPADVSDFTINLVNTVAHFYWTPNTESDLDYYIIRFTSLTTGATYEDAVQLFPKIPKTISSMTGPARTGTYFIKAFDTLGKSSENAVSITTYVESIKELNAVATASEVSPFGGTFTNTLENSEGYLILDNTVLWDDLSGNIDDWIGLLDAGGGSQGSVASTGYYEFENYVDLGSKYTSRVTATITQQALSYADSVDALQGNIDDLEGLWDDLNSAATATNVKLQVAITDDDPAGSPTWGSWIDFFVGDYTARALKFRAVLTSSDVNQTPRITSMSVAVDMPDRVEAGQDISSGAGTYSVSFSPAFKAISGIAISIQDGTNGDYYEITNKSGSGFDITFYKGMGAVDRTFDYTVKGYGYLAT